MTYLVEPDPQATGPLVHALVIGVAGYRHLPGGSEPVSHDTIVRHQLRSPASSALAFAEWVRTEMHHPDATLGSIDVLVSPRPGVRDPRCAGLELPSVDATVKAIWRWADLCRQNPANVAMFFFSGHGLALRSQLLLMEDFGRNPMLSCDAAIEVEELVAGMCRFVAETQYFFIDACREIPHQLTEYDSRTAPVFDGRIVEEQRKEWGVVSSTRMGRPAYGRRRGVSLFTEHLLASLRGRAARRKDSRWSVSLLALHESVSTLTERHSPAGREPQFAESRFSGDRLLHLLPGPPQVDARICCRPEKATGAARVRIVPTEPAPTEPALTEPAPDGPPAVPVLREGWWSTPLTAGVHEVSLDFEAGEYLMGPPPKRYLPFEPFDCDHTIDVRETG
ncbi:caspase family protein [Streptacidiphilus sp. EB129]|uniref:caspase family protein n=1 Tax=Streptacidiphilus sp. EB129 TaxID=3156262 RepID=UPI00351448AF